MSQDKTGLILSTVIDALGQCLSATADGTASLIDNENWKRQREAFVKAIKVTRIEQKNRDEKNSDEKVKINGKNVQLNDSNCVIYSTKGLGYEALSRELWDKNKIPCVAFSNSENNTVFMCVPIQCKDVSDKIVDELNKKISKTEISEQDFKLINGDSGRQYHGLSSEQVEILRENLRGTGVGFCVRDEQDGEFSIAYPEAKEVSDRVQRALMKTLGQTMGANGEHEIKRIISLRETAETAIKELNSSKVVYLADASNSRGALFRCDKTGMTEITDNGSRVIVRRDNKDFDEIVEAKVRGMKAPILKALEARKKEEHRADIYSRDALRAAKEGMALSDAANGKTAQAESFAIQILSLRVCIDGIGNKELANVLNTSVSMSSLVVDGKDSQGISSEMKSAFNAYGELGLSPEEDANVVKFVSSVYGTFEENIEEFDEKEQDEKDGPLPEHGEPNDNDLGYDDKEGEEEDNPGGEKGIDE